MQLVTLRYKKNIKCNMTTPVPRILLWLYFSRAIFKILDTTLIFQTKELLQNKKAQSSNEY